MATATEPNCRRVTLQPKPKYTISAAFSSSGEELALVDINRASFLRYALDGSLLGEVRRPGGGRLEYNHPTAVQPLAQGFLGRASPGHLLWLNSKLEPTRATWFREMDGSALDSQEEYVPIDFLEISITSRSLSGIGIFKVDGKSWAGAFRASLEPYVLQKVLWQIEFTQHGRLYLLTSGIVTASEQAVYALYYGETNSIREISPNERVLNAFPRGFNGSVDLPENRGAAGDPSRSRALERSTVAISLYAHSSYLFLLTRQPGAEGKTHWQLHQIDPVADRLVRSLTLPTTANHLVVAPGPKVWAFLEKGPLIRSGHQEIGDLLLIPTHWVEDEESEVLVHGNPTPTCD